MPSHAPLGFGQTSVWTGQELIVWSGAYRADGSGAAFNPRTGRWRDIPPYRLIAERSPVTLWTGREMILWGGTDGALGPPGETLSNSGAIFDPRSNRWRPIPAAPLTGGRPYVGVWTGSEVLIWGIGGSPSKPRTEMAVFDPASGAWESLDPGPLGVRYETLAAYTGKEFLVWGGAVGDIPDQQYYMDGAAYDPRTKRWRRMASPPIEERSLASGVWTGNRFFVWGGRRQDVAFYRDGAAYDPVSDTWDRIVEAPIEPRYQASLTWTGRGVIVRSGIGLNPGADTHTPRIDAAIYLPATRTWLSLPSPDLAPRSNEQTAWTGTQLIVWSGCCTESGGLALPFSDGAVYTP